MPQTASPFLNGVVSIFSAGPDAEDDSIEGACSNKISEECSEKIGLGQAGTAMEIGFGALQAIMGLLDPDFGPEWELCIQVHPQSPGKSKSVPFRNLK